MCVEESFQKMYTFNPFLLFISESGLASPPPKAVRYAA